MAGQPSVRCRFDAEDTHHTNGKVPRGQAEISSLYGDVYRPSSAVFDVSVTAATNRLKDLGIIRRSDTTDYSYASAIMDFAGVVGS